MEKNDWQGAGEQIKKLVQDAVESQDFSQLSDTITGVVNDTVNSIQDSIQQNLAKAAQKETYQRTNSEAAERIRKNLQDVHARRAEQAKDRSVKLQRPPRLKNEIAGNVMKWTGFSLCSIFGLSAAIVVAAAGFQIVPIVILGSLFAGSFALGYHGNSEVKLVRSFRRYQEILGDRTYCPIAELAAGTGESTKTVRKNLKKMIGEGYFRQGYLDAGETTLITDRSTYQQYQSSQAEYERRKHAEYEAQAQRAAADSKAASDREKLPPECQEILREGEKYIRHIQECNQRIPGEEITEKLNRLELVVTRIFREMEKNPSRAADLKKMMSYYLPTTSKLLDAYCEMDAQPVSGENIASTKKEIENALDTINTAFENLLDSMFQDEAWDISSDVSVLKTMLAQEGLTGNSGFGA